MTATIAENDLDTDWLELLDSDEEEPTPCDAKSCEKRAVWKLTSACCANITLTCQEHFDNLLERMKESAGMMCVRCSRVFIPSTDIIASAERI